MADVEVTGLGELLAALDRAESRSVPAVAAVVKKGAVNIKEDWQRRWTGLAHAPAVASSVTFDTAYGFSTVEAEIGPDKNLRQGPLGNLLEYGSEHNAPIPGGLPAAKTEAPRFERALGDLGAGLIEGRL